VTFYAATNVTTMAALLASFSPSDAYVRARAWLVSLAGGSTEAELVFDVVVLVLLTVFTCLALRASTQQARNISEAFSRFILDAGVGIIKLALCALLTYVLVHQTLAAYARTTATPVVDAPLSAARRIVTEQFTSKSAALSNATGWLEPLWRLWRQQQQQQQQQQPPASPPQ